MSYEELYNYFGSITLPEPLRLDRACTQIDVKEHVEQLLINMKEFPENWRHHHRLLKIKNALENPYNGPEIPRF
jgi:hypothetical protein